MSEESPLGTGGAIRIALEATHEASVFILNGDTYLECDYSEMLKLHSSSGTVLMIAVTGVKSMARYGGVILEGDRVTSFIEKGCADAGWINAGTYVLNRNFVWPQNLPARFSFEADVLVPFLPQLHHAVYMSHSHFLDIGVPEDLDRAQVELATLPFGAISRL